MRKMKGKLEELPTPEEIRDWDADIKDTYLNYYYYPYKKYHDIDSHLEQQMKDLTRRGGRVAWLHSSFNV